MSGDHLRILIGFTREELELMLTVLRNCVTTQQFENQQEKILVLQTLLSTFRAVRDQLESQRKAAAEDTPAFDTEEVMSLAEQGAQWLTRGRSTKISEAATNRLYAVYAAMFHELVSLGVPPAALEDVKMTLMGGLRAAYQVPRDETNQTAT